MTDDNAIRRRLTATGSAAALVGLGAVLGGPALAASSADHNQINTQAQSVANGEVALRVDDGRLFLSQGGRDLGEVRLTDTPASAALKALLAGDRALEGLSPLVVADGAGGNSWLRPPPPTQANDAEVKKAVAGGQGTGRTSDVRGAKADAQGSAKPKTNE